MPVKNENKYKFLLITPSYACVPITGAGQRTMLIFNALKKIGDIDIIIIGAGKNNDFFKNNFSEAKNIKCVEPLARAEVGFWRILRPLCPKLIDKAATAFGARKCFYTPDKAIQNELAKLYQTNKYNVVIGRYLRPTVRAGALAIPNLPVILDLDDRDDVVYRSRLNRPNLNILFRLLLMWHEKQMLEIMPSLLKKASHIWLTSEADSLAIEHHAKSVLPNIDYNQEASFFTNHDERRQKSNDSKTILFVGAFGHRANREAIDHFIKKCWPKINATVKDAKFRIVGSGGWESKKVDTKHINGLEIIGFVEDLSIEYSSAAFSVIPIFEGGGTKIKVLESLRHNRTAVISTHAQYGYEQLKNRESLIVAANDEEIINGCIEMLNNTELRTKLAAKGNASISMYSFQNFSSIVSNTISSVLN